MSRIFKVGQCVAVVAVAFSGIVTGKEKPAAVDLSYWVGDWSASAEQDISIVLDERGGLYLEGFAAWGAQDPDRVDRGAINFGEFSAHVMAGWVRADGRLVFAVGPDGSMPASAAEQYDCVITLQLRGEVMVAEDNMMCGGHNVTFTGTYQRRTD
ncbi:hypothetical protein [Devosia sp. Naph2]|uniref:hypothetical protein n=1 Tax=Devosia polycyclovorans TaxID=3345148 RepID=UPI0035CF93B9